MEEMNPTDHGILALGLHTPVDRILERVAFCAADISVAGLKIWNILCPESGQEIAFIFYNIYDERTMLYMEKAGDNQAIPSFIHPSEVMSISLNGGMFPKADPSRVYVLNEPEHLASAITLGFSAVNGDVADPAVVNTNRSWLLTLNEGEPLSGLPVLHRLAHEMRCGTILPLAVERQVDNTIMRVSGDNEGGHNLSFMAL